MLCVYQGVITHFKGVLKIPILHGSVVLRKWVDPHSLQDKQIFFFYGYGQFGALERMFALFVFLSK